MADPARRSGQDLEPIGIDTPPIVWAGVVVWAVALVVALLVPAFHRGDRDFWPWTCGCGLLLGLVGVVYLHRVRGNAAFARRGLRRR